MAVQFALLVYNFVYKAEYTRQAYPVALWPSDMDAPLDVSLSSLLDSVDQARPGLCNLVGTHVDSSGKRCQFPLDFSQNTPVIFRWALSIAHHIFNISSIQLIAYGSQCTRAHCSVAMGWCTVVVWRKSDRAKYFVKEAQCEKTLRIHDFIPKDNSIDTLGARLPEQHS